MLYKAQLAVAAAVALAFAHAAPTEKPMPEQGPVSYLIDKDSALPNPPALSPHSSSSDNAPVNLQVDVDTLTQHNGFRRFFPLFGLNKASAIDVNIEIDENTDFKDLEVHVIGALTKTTLRFEGDQIRALRKDGDLVVNTTMQATPLAIALSSLIPIVCLGGLALCVALLLYVRDLERQEETMMEELLSDPFSMEYPEKLSSPGKKRDQQERRLEGYLRLLRDSFGRTAPPPAYATVQDV